MSGQSNTYSPTLPETGRYPRTNESLYKRGANGFFGNTRKADQQNDSINHLPEFCIRLAVFTVYGLYYSVVCSGRFHSGCKPALCVFTGYTKFFEYYQIGGEDEPHEAEVEPNRKGELRGHVEGSHSPFGIIWEIAKATGWKVHYIMWKINYQTLILMMSDAVRYIEGKKKGKKGGSALGFFQTQLKERKKKSKK